MDIDDHQEMTYRITCAARASGHQYYIVEADSVRDAIEKFENDQGEFEYEELEVNHIEVQSADLIEEQ